MKHNCSLIDIAYEVVPEQLLTYEEKVEVSRNFKCLEKKPYSNKLSHMFLGATIAGHHFSTKAAKS